MALIISQTGILNGWYQYQTWVSRSVHY